MAIAQVRAQINGQWYTLTYDREERCWKAQLTIDKTSFHQPGGYYSAFVEATNETGGIVTADSDTLETLRLKVAERVRPVITLAFPTEPFTTDNLTPVIVDVTDDDSGADMDTFLLTVDGLAVQGEVRPTEDGYQVTWTPTEALPDGIRTIRAEVTDYDGNTGTLDASFIVDTTPPVLDIFNHDLVVDRPFLMVTGYTNDETLPPVTVEVESNGVPVGSPDVDAEGLFSLEVPLVIGDNLIRVAATDRAGWKTEFIFLVIRLVTDRTQTDVNQLTALLRAGYAAWSDADREWYEAIVCRGAYNAEDLNRVEWASEYMALLLRELPEELKIYAEKKRVAWDRIFDVPYDPEDYHLDTKTDWAVEDIPVPTQMERYLGNVAMLRAAVAYQTDALPQSMEKLAYDGANAIELALVNLSGALALLRAEKMTMIDHAVSVLYSGEIFAGEV